MKLGLSDSETQDAIEHHLKVRYWPLEGRRGTPHEGWVRAAETVGGRRVVWLTGKAGYVLASHCEFVAGTRP